MCMVWRDGERERKRQVQQKAECQAEKESVPQRLRENKEGKKLAWDIFEKLLFALFLGRAGWGRGGGGMVCLLSSTAQNREKNLW